MPAEAGWMNKHFYRVEMKLCCVYTLQTRAVGSRKLRFQKLCHKDTQTQARGPSLQFQQGQYLMTS
jgi:hypothetical protein